MNNDQDIQPKAIPVKLDGFAAPAGNGASASLPAAGATAAAPSAVAGGGAGAAAPAAATKKTPPASAQTAKQKKKRGPKKGGASSAATSTDNSTNNDEEETVIRPLSDLGAAFEPLSLPQIKLRLNSLIEKLPADTPPVPPQYNAANSAEHNGGFYAPIKEFASTVQVTIEEYNLLLSLVSAATYRWGVDRSGASQQNLGVMSAELQACQDVISNVVSARLSNVLCPAVDVLIGEVEIVRDGDNNDNGDAGDGEEATVAKKRKLNEDRLLSTSTKRSISERRINHYTRPLVDPSYVHLCHCILSRNAALIRHTVATSIYTAQKVIGDYLNAMKKDSSHEDSKGGYY